MAASLPSSVLNKHLRCELCHGDFADPRRLRCKHTFCQNCLQKNVDRGATETARLWFLCPKCRTIVDVPAAGASGFRKNGFVTMIQTLVQQMKITDLSTSDEWLAQHCSMGSANCSFCRAQEGRFYCHTCKEVLCGTCMMSTHKVHDISQLEEGANRDRDKLSSLLHGLQTEILQSQRVIADLQHSLKRLRKSKENALDGVVAQLKKLRALLDAAESTLVDTINVAFKDEQSKLNTQVESSEEMLGLLVDMKEFTTDFLRSSSDAQVIAWQENISSTGYSLISGINRTDEEYLLQRPLHIKHIVSSVDPNRIITRSLGRVSTGRTWTGYTSRGILAAGQGGNSHDFCASKMTAISQPIRCDVLKTLGITPGTLIDSFSVFTDGSTSPPLCTDISVLLNDDILVVDSGNKSVKFFKKACHGMYRKVHTSDSAWGVAMLGDRKVAVTDHTVHIFDTDGRLQKVLRQQPRDSRGIAINSQGEVVVSDCTSRCIYILSPVGGSIRRIITQHAGQPFRQPQYVAIGLNDSVIVADSLANCVAIFSEKGEFLSQFGDVSAGSDRQGLVLNSPCGICTDETGNIIVCDKGNNRILLLDPAGNFLCTLLEGKELVDAPQAVTTDSRGYLVVCELRGKVKLWKCNNTSNVR